MLGHKFAQSCISLATTENTLELGTALMCYYIKLHYSDSLFQQSRCQKLSFIKSRLCWNSYDTVTPMIRLLCCNQDVTNKSWIKSWFCTFVLLIAEESENIVTVVLLHDTTVYCQCIRCIALQSQDRKRVINQVCVHLFWKKITFVSVISRPIPLSIYILYSKGSIIK